MINRKIVDYLNSNNLIVNSQHGFQAGKSTDTILLSFYDYVTDCLDRNKVIDAIFFDFQKAFDTIPHNVLINKLLSFGFRGQALHWIKDFLSNRHQRVRIGNVCSRSLPVTSGLIQGSVLGPTLFNIFINDIDTRLKHSSILKYADDIRIFNSSPKQLSELLNLKIQTQNDIDSLVRWASDSGMTFNVEKCFSVSFGSSDFLRTYSIDNTVIPVLSSFKDLGILVNSSLSFNSHIDTITAKSFNRLALINKVFRNKTKYSITKLYKAYVRPILDYGSIIWYPYTSTNIGKLECVQRRKCRMVPDFRTYPYHVQLKSLGLLSLQARRIRFQLISIYKIFKGFTKINFDDLFERKKTHNTRAHSCHIIPKHATKNYRLNFFTVSAIRHWNSLSNDDVSVSTTNLFKVRVDAFLLKKNIL